MHARFLQPHPLLIGIACLLLAQAAAAAEPSTPAQWTLSFTGFGPVKFGMTVREAGEAMKLKLSEDAPSRRCHFAVNDGQLSGVEFMVLDGVIVRADVFNISNRTADGAGVGMTEAWVKKLHPQIKVDRHPRDPAGHYLILPGGDGKHAILFETDGQAITGFRAGQFEPLAMINGCR